MAPRKPSSKKDKTNTKVVKKIAKTKKKPATSKKKSGTIKKKTTTPKKKTTTSKKKSATATKRNISGSSSDNKVAEFRPNSKEAKGDAQHFDKVKCVGWVNIPIRLGLLTKIREEGFRVIFEFYLNGKRFDAWSSKKTWARKNSKLLKTGYNYVLTGTMRVQTLSEDTRDRSSNSDFCYKVLLAEVEVKEKAKVKDWEKMVEKSTLKTIKQKAVSQKPFTLDATNVKIVSGEVRRYMGCETCFTGISKPDANGKFFCKLCIKIEKEKLAKDRRVCMMIRNLTLKDENTTLDNILCFHQQCVEIFGQDETERLCKTSSDLVPRRAFKKLYGTVIAATIKHQAPSGSHAKKFNTFKLCVGKFLCDTPLLKDPTDEDDSKKVEIPDSQKSTKLPANSTRCPCEDDNDEGDEIIDASMNIQEDEPMASTSSSAQFSPPESFVLDTSGSNVVPYEVKRNANGHIGLGIIINMSFKYRKEYPEDIQVPERRGSMHNVQTFKNLFENIEFKLFRNEPLLDINKNEFEEAMVDLKKELVEGNYSSLFFVLMSHGTLHTIKLRGGKRLSVFKDIIPKFGERDFPQFLGKPKVFVLNACQYFTEETYRDAIGLDIDDTQKIPDVLLFVPCRPGVKAKRHKVTGSYFMEMIAKVITENKDTMHVEEMFAEVQRRMGNFRFGVNKDAYNVPVYTPLIFGYFYLKESSNAILY